MTALLITGGSTPSYVWIGNSPNLASEPAKNGHLNVACEAHQVLRGKFVEWFVHFWQHCSPLTPLTARVPALVPAVGGPEAARSWVAYEQLCKRREYSKAETAESDQTHTTGSDDGKPSPTVDQGSRDSVVAALCKELNIPPPDAMKARVALLLDQGEIVTIDKNSRTPPMELPLTFGDEGETVGSISRTSSYRIKIFDDVDSKELEKRRNGVTDLIQRFTDRRKNASADMSLRGNTFITVMQTAELRDLDDPADTRDLARNRTLLVEAQMGPRSVVL